MMSKNKKKFIDKLNNKTKKELVEIIVDLWEERFYLEKKIHHMKTLCLSHEQVLKHVLNHQNPKMILHVLESDDDEDETDPEETKESLRSYV